MDSLRAKRFEFFCPLCCSLQRTHTVQKIGWQHHLGITTATLVFTLFLWNIFGAKGLSTYLFLWGAFEVSYRIRKRAEFICKNCGFDPFLYRRDVNKMRAEVKTFLQNRILNEGHFRGKKLKNYKTADPGIVSSDAAPTTKDAGGKANKGEDKPDKTVIPMPTSGAGRKEAPRAPTRK